MSYTLSLFDTSQFKQYKTSTQTQSQIKIYDWQICKEILQKCKSLRVCKKFQNSKRKE
jgi:hypothetical protein